MHFFPFLLVLFHVLDYLIFLYRTLYFCFSPPNFYRSHTNTLSCMIVSTLLLILSFEGGPRLQFSARVLHFVRDPVRPTTPCRLRHSTVTAHVWRSGARRRGVSAGDCNPTEKKEEINNEGYARTCVMYATSILRLFHRVSIIVLGSVVLTNSMTIHPHP